MKITPQIALAMTLLATPAFAFSGGERPSQEEIAAERAELFLASDTDADGSLSLEEFETFTELAHANRRQKNFDRLDRDENGALSSEEVQNGGHRPPRRSRR